RDYIHVTDLAAAHIKALEYLLAGGQSAAFNLGTGKGYSVKEIVEAARNITARGIAVIDGQRRFGDPPCLISASQKARDVLGWSPVCSDINTIIRHAWLWHEKRFKTKKTRRTDT
ncbi:MAG: UDP-glucose 4-epimerase GalE, partial [Deltaproteobacteria bacterium]|nr:UDP-glucose 4-epimerase GalE [Deltaproteobacteria bacterium]